MILFKTSLISKVTLLLVATMLSVSATALDFNQTQRLANQGVVEAQNILGLLYKEGDGVRQDYGKAVEWFKKAADQGYASGQYNMGYAYSSGQGVRQDYSKALEWFKKAADQNNNFAQFHIGAIYEIGQSVRHNKATAKEWYGKACDNGNQIGCNNYKRLNEQGY